MLINNGFLGCLFNEKLRKIIIFYVAHRSNALLEGVLCQCGKLLGLKIKKLTIRRLFRFLFMSSISIFVIVS